MTLTTEPQRTANLTRGLGFWYGRYVPYTSSGVHETCPSKGCCYTPPYYSSSYCSRNYCSFGYVECIQQGRLSAYSCISRNCKPQPSFRWSGNWSTHSEYWVIGQGQNVKSRTWKVAMPPRCHHTSMSLCGGSALVERREPVSEVSAGILRQFILFEFCQ